MPPRPAAPRPAAAGPAVRHGHAPAPRRLRARHAAASRGSASGCGRPDGRPPSRPRRVPAPSGRSRRLRRPWRSASRPWRLPAAHPRRPSRHARRAPGRSRWRPGGPGGRPGAGGPGRRWLRRPSRWRRLRRPSRWWPAWWRGPWWRGSRCLRSGRWRPSGPRPQEQEAAASGVRQPRCAVDGRRRRPRQRRGRPARPRRLAGRLRRPHQRQPRLAGAGGVHRARRDGDRDPVVHRRDLAAARHAPRLRRADRHPRGGGRRAAHQVRPVLRW